MDQENEKNKRSNIQTSPPQNNPRPVLASNQENNDHLNSQPKSRNQKEQKRMDSPYQDLIKNLMAINSRYSKQP
jgi:hypothetical protein